MGVNLGVSSLQRLLEDRAERAPSRRGPSEAGPWAERMARPCASSGPVERPRPTLQTSNAGALWGPSSLLLNHSDLGCLAPFPPAHAGALLLQERGFGADCSGPPWSPEAASHTERPKQSESANPGPKPVATWCCHPCPPADALLLQDRAFGRVSEVNGKGAASFASTSRMPLLPAEQQQVSF